MKKYIDIIENLEWSSYDNAEDIEKMLGELSDALNKEVAS